MPNLPQQIVNNFSSIRQHVGDLFQRAMNGTQVSFNRANAATAPATSTYPIQGRNVSLNSNDFAQMRDVLFSEISNRDSQKQQLEGRTIVNTALNRIPQYAAHGQNYSLSQVLQQPNQYQGYGSKEYQRIVAGSTTPADTQKLQSIDAVLGQLKSGNFPDNTGGDVYYQHDPTGRIWLKDGALFK